MFHLKLLDIVVIWKYGQGHRVISTGKAHAMNSTICKVLQLPHLRCLRKSQKFDSLTDQKHASYIP